MGLPIFQFLSPRPHPAGSPFAPDANRPLPRSMLIKASLILLMSMLAGIATAAEQARTSSSDNPLLHPPKIHLQLTHGNEKPKSVPATDDGVGNPSVVADTTEADAASAVTDTVASYAAAAAVSPVLNTLAGTPTASSQTVVSSTSEDTSPSETTPASNPKPDPSDTQPPGDTTQNPPQQKPDPKPHQDPSSPTPNN